MKLVKTFGRGRVAAEAMIAALEQRGATNTSKVETVVRRIVDDVRDLGDNGLHQYVYMHDGLAKGQDFQVARKVTGEEMHAAWQATAPKIQMAMKAAQTNIRVFAEAQRPKEWTIKPEPGVTTGQIVRPLGSVGCYVPGGRYPLPSTLLMTVTPAQVAGVERIVVCSPRPARETMAAGWLAGVNEFYRMGGAQAIAAMAYGTETIIPVDKIVGPGNLYVTAAKQMVAQDCGIDMPAGPTEIVVTSEKGSAAGIAADMVAQAEHDPESRGFFI
jgi:histidinol dehydrogenase